LCSSSCFSSCRASRFSASSSVLLVSRMDMRTVNSLTRHSPPFRRTEAPSSDTSKARGDGIQSSTLYRVLGSVSALVYTGTDSPVAWSYMTFSISSVTALVHSSRIAYCHQSIPSVRHTFGR
jgi:hypothetical protein